MKGILKNKETGDMTIINGSVAIGNNTDDVIAAVMLSNAGDFKHSPMLGANLIYHINDETITPINLRNIKQQLMSEHIAVNTIEIVNSKLKVDYEND